MYHLCSNNGPQGNILKVQPAAAAAAITCPFRLHLVPCQYYGEELIIQQNYKNTVLLFLNRSCTKLQNIYAIFEISKMLYPHQCFFLRLVSTTEDWNNNYTTRRKGSYYSQHTGKSLCHDFTINIQTYKKLTSNVKVILKPTWHFLIQICWSIPILLHTCYKFTMLIYKYHFFLASHGFDLHNILYFKKCLWGLGIKRVYYFVFTCCSNRLHCLDPVLLPSYNNPLQHHNFLLSYDCYLQ